MTRQRDEAHQICEQLVSQYEKIARDAVASSEHLNKTERGQFTELVSWNLGLADKRKKIDLQV